MIVGYMYRFPYVFVCFLPNTPRAEGKFVSSLETNYLDHQYYSIVIIFIVVFIHLQLVAVLV